MVTKILPTQKILVIANDAGGAEIIAAYIKQHAHKNNFCAYLAGPAMRVFHREQILFKRLPADKKEIAKLLEKNMDAKFALLGTGWMTSIELDVLREFKRLGIKTVVYLESWNNYRERFGYPERGWRGNLPDEIWAGDEYSFVLAKKYFSKTLIRLIPNQYFVNIICRYKKEKVSSTSPLSILFLSDPVAGMENLLEDILARVSETQKPSSLRIRFHPSDNRKRYDKIIQKYKGIMSVQKSREKDIVWDLLQSYVVIGNETVAMIAALLVEIKTISINITGKKSQLPFPKIIHVKNAKDAVRLI